MQPCPECKAALCRGCCGQPLSGSLTLTAAPHTSPGRRWQHYPRHRHCCELVKAGKREGGKGKVGRKRDGLL
eukprot:122762-Chlamydomonas_euryale.AAC.7